MTVSCFINQVIDYPANLAELFVTPERSFPFSSTVMNSECCDVMLFMFRACVRISHINVGHGDRDNLILSFLMKVNKQNMLKHSRFVINMTGDFSRLMLFLCD